VRDLLGVSVNVASLLPADDVGPGGFDNMADALTVSPALFEQYMTAATKIARRAVASGRGRAMVDTYRVSDAYLQEDRMNDDLPFASFGGLAPRHYFPANADYVIAVRLQRSYNDCIRGMGTRHQLELRIDGTLVRQFSLGGDAPGRMAPKGYCGGTLGDREWEAYIHEADKGLEVRVPVRAGTHVVGVSFVRQTVEPEGVFRKKLVPNNRAADELWDGYPAIEYVSIGGPYEGSGVDHTDSTDKVLVCQPSRSADETRCATEILSRLARRAYRRPATQSEVRTLLAFFERGRQQDDFSAGIELAIERLLVDPSFLFRFAAEPGRPLPNGTVRMSDLDFAARLSFFLWSSGPDDELLDLAIGKKLDDPRVVDRQVRRMLADSRSKALVDNFVGQWLMIRNVRDITPDPSLFLEFDDSLRDAFWQETTLFVESLIQENRSALELLNGNYTFANERLAQHYGIPNVYGSRFRRVNFTDDRRGGILGQAGLLAVTSYPNRTSPVLRGKWILDVLLGSPPPPPPANVPSLPATAEGGRPASVRERLELHRKNPVCATCHSQMDPLGLLLENFDGVGRWRTMDEGNTPINSAAVFGGTELKGLTGLRSFMLSHKEEFVRTVIEKLLAYGLGRPARYVDQPSIRKIAREAGPDYRWSSIILGIVRSEPFQTVRSPGYAN
jgi:hypothetical protein